MLSYDMENPMSEEDFLDSYGQIITEKDFITLKNAKLVPVEDLQPNKTLEKWNSWERTLRNELVKMRANKKAQDGEKYLVDGEFETATLEIAREIFQASNPLDAELILNKARWDYLEELEVGHHFDIVGIIVYFLKLQILQRKLQINKEKGKTAFSEIYNIIHEKNSTKENN